MGLIMPTTLHPEREDQPLPYEWFVGIDWGSQQHQVSVLDRDRRRVGERVVDHDGASLARLADWLWTLSAGQPQRVAVAINYQISGKGSRIRINSAVTIQRCAHMVVWSESDQSRQRSCRWRSRCRFAIGTWWW